MSSPENAQVKRSLNRAVNTQNTMHKVHVLHRKSKQKVIINHRAVKRFPA